MYLSNSVVMKFPFKFKSKMVKELKNQKIEIHHIWELQALRPSLTQTPLSSTKKTPSPEFKLPRAPLQKTSVTNSKGLWSFLADRNRSDCCHLRLRCPSRTPEIASDFRHCDLRLRWKVARDPRFRAAMSEPKKPCFCRISGDLARSTQKTLVIAIVRFWCAKCSFKVTGDKIQGPSWGRPRRQKPPLVAPSRATF